MSKFKYGKKSRKVKKELHPDLQLILNTLIRITAVDVGLAEGYRSPKKQNKEFKAGRSKIDGIKVKGKHNFKPARAVDIYAYYDGAAHWDIAHLTYIAGQAHAIAEMLFEAGIIQHRLRWGGNWDQDGKIIIDQSFDDLGHLELTKG